MATGLKSFLDISSDSHFSIQNLPYGVFKPSPEQSPRPAVAIGDYVLDLSALARAGLFQGPLLKGSDCFLQVRTFYKPWQPPPLGSASRPKAVHDTLFNWKEIRGER